MAWEADFTNGEDTWSEPVRYPATHSLEEVRRVVESRIEDFNRTLKEDELPIRVLRVRPVAPSGGEDGT